MPSLSPSAVELVSVGFDHVEFVAVLPDRSERPVTVLVGGGTSWRKSMRFPNLMFEEGRSLGDDLLDDQIRRRAAEELVRLAAAVGAIERRRAA
jgi:hypothetical protein